MVAYCITNSQPHTAGCHALRFICVIHPAGLESPRNYPKKYYFVLKGLLRENFSSLGNKHKVPEMKRTNLFFLYYLSVIING